MEMDHVVRLHNALIKISGVRAAYQSTHHQSWTQSSSRFCVEIAGHIAKEPEIALMAKIKEVVRELGGPQELTISKKRRHAPELHSTLDIS